MTQQYEHLLKEAVGFYEHGDAVLEALLHKAGEGDENARYILHSTLNRGMDGLEIAKRRGTDPGLINFFTKKRMAWSWRRHAPLGALEQLVFLASLTYAIIVKEAGPKTGIQLSQVGFVLGLDTLTKLMHFIATDSEIVIDKPFPYSQDEMRRSFEEHSPNIERAWG